MAQYRPPQRGLLEVDAVLRGTQMRLCGRWAGRDASAQLVNRWISELEPLLDRQLDQPSTDESRHDDESTSIVAANLDRLAHQLCREYEARK